MLQYLIILLDDKSVSFCHHRNRKKERHQMPMDVLREGIKFGMKENLQIQFVLSEYPMPQDYWIEMMSIDHSIIASGECGYEELIPKKVFYQLPDVLTFEDIKKYINYLKHPLNQQITYVLRIRKEELFSKAEVLASSLSSVLRLNIILTDIDSFSDDDFKKYQKSLLLLSEGIKNAYSHGLTPQLNLLTDRILLNEMNNCDAGDKSITLAPDGKFYICPAFYQDNADTPIRKKLIIGSLKEGVDIKNSSLYRIDHAPLCRICDAFQCKRCIWLNYKTTYEVNTPSHEQCVIAHLERKVSRKLLYDFTSVS